MYIACQEGGLETTGQSVDDNAKRYQKACCIDVDASECVNDGRAAEEEHGGNDCVGHEAKAQKDDVGSSSPSVGIKKC